VFPVLLPQKEPRVNLVPLGTKALKGHKVLGVELEEMDMTVQKDPWVLQALVVPQAEMETLVTMVHQVHMVIQVCLVLLMTHTCLVNPDQRMKSKLVTYGTVLLLMQD
jgi:hypothetical protein